MCPCVGGTIPQLHKYIFHYFPGNTSELIPGGSGVAVVLQNVSGRDVILEPHTEVGMVTAANIVPSIQILNKQELNKNENVQCKSAQTNLSGGKIQQEETDPEDIIQKTDLLGIADWDPMIQQEAQDLIHEYACIFSQNDQDLDKTSIVKHSIKLTNPTPLKNVMDAFHLECMKKERHIYKECLR